MVRLERVTQGSDPVDGCATRLTNTVAAGLFGQAKAVSEFVGIHPQRHAAFFRDPVGGGWRYFDAVREGPRRLWGRRSKRSHQNDAVLAASPFTGLEPVDRDLHRPWHGLVALAGQASVGETVNFVMRLMRRALV